MLSSIKIFLLLKISDFFYIVKYGSLPAFSDSLVFLLLLFSLPL